MSRRRRIVVAVGLLLAAGVLAVGVLLLRAQGLDRADKWASVVGMFSSVLLGGAGVVLGWLTWRHDRRADAGAGGQTVAGSVVGGAVHQISDHEGSQAVTGTHVGGDVRQVRGTYAADPARPDP